jgi:hypothetical protein
MDYRTFANSTGPLTPETEQGLGLLGLSLLPQRIAPHNSCFRDADSFHPGLLTFQQGRLLVFADR